MTVLTKQDILMGIKSLKKVEIEALGGEIWLRPLSSAEVNEVLNIEAQGYGTFNASNNRGQTMTDGKLNVAKMQEKQAEAKYNAIHKSINNKSNDEWSYEEIKELPNNAVDEIYKKIMDLSGVDVTEADVKQFPEDQDS